MMLEPIQAVMPGLVPGIHVLTVSVREKTWMAGTSPAMMELIRSAACDNIARSHLNF
jgi:hypothetical protein